MSGIAGIIHFDGTSVESGQIEKMTSAMQNRGPDGIQHWQKDSVALGQCMFRTTPESLEEVQPWSNEDESLVLVLDGRVDNYLELREDLLTNNIILRNRSDAELVLRSYELWGDACLDKIIGEFAFFIWNVRDKHLFAGRDVAGTRHFYYYEGNGWFAFASEIKGLLALEIIKPVLNETRLLDYLIEEYDRDDEVGTFYQGVSRMPAGHAMKASLQGIHVWRYWDPSTLPPLEFGSLEDCAEAFLEQLRIAVKCRLRSIGPVGAMLSGGLDSSSIVGLIRKEFREDLAEPLRTISLIRDDRENCPDWKHTQEMLEDGWIKPTIITSALPPESCQSYIDDISKLDEPFTLSKGLTYSLVYEAAKSAGCKIVFDGIAGDLLFYGPNRSLDIAIRRKRIFNILNIYTAFRRHKINKEFFSQALLSVRATLPRYLRKSYRYIFGPRKITSIELKLFDTALTRKYCDFRQAEREKYNGKNTFTNDQIFHSRNFTSGALSFAHEVYNQIALNKGVEPRSPFSDRRVLEFAVRMPLEAKLCSQWYKRVLRISMNGILPKSVQWRKDLGNHPGWRFFECILNQLVQSNPDIWNSENVACELGDWADKMAVRAFWKEHLKSPSYPRGMAVIPAVVLAKWLQSSIQSPQRSNN